jgi:cyclopropane fatty-acyl-phospholipid synthase-like methyltransferase
MPYVDVLKNKCFTGCRDDGISDYSMLEAAYGIAKNNWGDRDIFQGGYINLGYWDDLSPNKIISIEERIKSARDLYLYVLKSLAPTPNDKVLEIGCGRGIGVADVIQLYNVKEFVGLDALQAQIDRAQKNVSGNAALKGAKIELLHTTADDTQQADKSIDAVFSVEVIQHIKKFKPLAKELKRILKDNGRAVFAAHLSTRSDSVQKMIAENLLFDEGTIDVFSPIGDMISAFEGYGFSTTCHSIGEKVFGGFEQWLMQGHRSNTVGLNLCKSYKNGYIDYFVVTVKSHG